MASHDPRFEGDGFVPFFRSYTKTWIHAVATAGLTAFGTLTIVHNWFAALALASYVLPPIALYLRRTGRDGRVEPDSATDDGNADSSVESGDSRRIEGDDAEDDGNGDETRRDEDGDEIPRDAPRKGEHAREWHVADVPTESTLQDVAVAGSKAVAVGTGGVVLADGGHGEWSVVLEDGPAAGANDLHGVDATPAGEAVWVAGDSGAVGRVDLATGRHTDYTAPRDVTDNWLGVAVGGTDAETVLLITGSGSLHRGRYRDGKLEWDDPVTPGSGSSLAGVVLADGVGYCCDTDDGVFETADGGESFDRIGIDGADGTLTDVATAPEGPIVSADDGVVHRYDGPAWTPERIADGAVTGLDCQGERASACTAAGTVLERPGPVAEWTRHESGVDGELRAIATGTGRTVAVGDAGCVFQGR